jgi:3-deoxy-D-manno-octulosonic-acid transferase
VNLFLRLGYEGAARLAGALSLFAPSGRGKVMESFAARRHVLRRFEEFQRDRARPLLWMHAPSVGEGLQARPVIDLVRKRLPDVQIAYTYFSPSARTFAASLDVDFHDLLPFDSSSAMRRAVDALSPTALVFSKLDVWPTLARRARKRGARLGMISATLAATSSRRGRIATAILRDAYSRLERVGAISRDDADRLIALGVPARRVEITGDTRYDQVWERAQATDLGSELLAPLASERLTVVAGSTWPADEAVLLPAWQAVANKVRTRLIIAPHEPTREHLDPIAEWAAAEHLTVCRLSEPGAHSADVILVDTVGQLGELYALADVAFVGGGFHAAGLHSVLEPAAFGVPTTFGPMYHGSRDARLLIDDDAAVAADDARSLATTLEHWLSDAAAREAAGEAAILVVHRGLGAAERSFALVRQLLS